MPRRKHNACSWCSMKHHTRVKCPLEFDGRREPDEHDHAIDKCLEGLMKIGAKTRSDLAALLRTATGDG